MIPKAISDAMTGATTAVSALPAKVPAAGSVVLTADEVTQIVAGFSALQTAATATATALDALVAPATTTSTAGETPVGP